MPITVATGTQRLNTLQVASLLGYNDILTLKSPSLSLGPSNATVLLMDKTTTGFDLAVTGSTLMTGDLQQTGSTVQTGSTTASSLTTADKLSVCYAGASISGSTLTSTGKFDIYADTSGSAKRLSVKPTGAIAPVASFCDDGRAWFTGQVRGDGDATFDGTLVGETLVATGSLRLGVSASVVDGAAVMPEHWSIAANSDAVDFVKGGTTYFSVTSSGTGSTQLSAGTVITNEVRMKGDTAQLLVDGDGRNVVIQAPSVSASALVTPTVKATGSVSLLSGASIASDGTLSETSSTTWALSNGTLHAMEAAYGGTKRMSVSTDGHVEASAGFIGGSVSTDTVSAKTSSLVVSGSNVDIDATGYLAASAPVYANEGIYVPKTTAFQNNQTTADAYSFVTSSGDLVVSDHANSFLKLRTVGGLPVTEMNGTVNVSDKLIVPVIGELASALTLKGTTITIDADAFNVRSGINQVSTTVLDVEDINITLGHNGTGAPVGLSSARDGAGIKVAGSVANIPEGGNQSDYQATLVWKNNSGMFDNTGAAVAAETRSSWMASNGHNMTLMGVGPDSSKFIFSVDGDTLKLFKRLADNTVSLVTTFA
jgi:hypothetical protein